MWKSVFEIRVIRVEGLDFIPQCEVLFNDSPMDFVVVSNSSPSTYLERRFAVDSNGQYRIQIKHSTSTFSVSFSKDLFEDDGMLWLPLFLNTADYLDKQPEEVSEPRLLLLVHKKLIEDQCSSLVTEESVVEQDFMPEIKLNYCDNTMIVYEDNEEPSFCHTSNYKDEISCDDNGAITTRTPEKSNILGEYSQAKYAEITREFQEHLKIQKDLANKILEEKQQKENELNLACSEILQLRNQLYKIEVENNYLRGLNSQGSGMQVAELVKELALCREKITELQKKNAYSVLEPSIAYEKSCTSLDKIIKIQCHQLKIQPLIRGDEEVYLYGSKKLNLLLKNGKLMCRTGGGLQEFKYFIKENSPEIKQVAYNSQSKSPFRKYLGDVNSSSETIKQSSRFSDNLPGCKPNSTRNTNRSAQKFKPVKKC